MAKYRYDVYTVTVPGDTNDEADRKVWLEEAAGIAINEARERAKLYCMPANWTATLVKGEQGDFEVTFRVVRKRIRRAA